VVRDGLGTTLAHTVPVRDIVRVEPAYMVVFYYEGGTLCGRVRDVRSQQQWIVRDASLLRRALTESVLHGEAGPNEE
jgi:hypothetical protein